MDNDVPLQGRFSDVHDGSPISDEGLLTQSQDPLALDIDDDDLVEVIDKRIKDIRRFYEDEYNLYERRINNEEYFFGRQILNEEKEHMIKDYESRFQDNVLWEIAANLKPLAMSRLPDLIVTPGNDSEQSRLMAQELTKAIDSQIKSRENRKVLGLAFQHRPVYFVGVIKARWDNELDDYVFEVIHPDMIDIDYNATSNDSDAMNLISQIVPMTVQEALMQFPEKEEKFIQELSKDGLKIKDGKPTWKDLATTIKVREIWFKWYKKHSEKEWETVWGVLWKYHDCILKKIKNPNYDYEGETKLFIADDRGAKHEAAPDELLQVMVQSMLTGIQPQNLSSEQVFNNYFDHPRHPYYFVTYDQWGKQPLDETSWLEQNIKNQQSLDKRGKQIDETLDSRGHYIWSKESGLKPADIQAMDMNNPEQDVLVDGPAEASVKYVEPQRPTPEQFQDLDRITQRMHMLAGDNAVQGEIQSDTATTNQIAREANFTRADDMVEDTINAAAEWMAQWSLQFIKLRYTEEHFKRLLGIAGEVIFSKLHRNMVEEGQIVMIKASGTDKLQAKNNAMDNQKMGMTDPVNYFRDMGYPDYQERAEMWLTFQMDKPTYAVKYVQNLQTSAEMANALLQNPEMELQAPMMQSPAMAPSPMMGQPMGQPPMAAPGQLPQNPTPQNTAQAPMAPPPGPPQGSPRIL